MKLFTKLIKPLSALIFAGFFTLHVNAQNNALDFDGASDYVEIPFNSTWVPPTKSVQLFVKINSITSQYQAIFTSGGNNSGYKGFALFVLPDGKWHVLVGNGGGSFIDLPGSAVTTGTWTNIAGTYDGVTLKFYINGILVNSLVTTVASNPSLPIRLGAGNNEGAPMYFLGGQIDELSMWNKTLSVSDITNNMNKGLSGSESGLLAYYNFNEGIGNGDNTTPPINTLNDLTSHALNGALNTFTLNGNASNWVNSGLILLPINLVNFEGSKKEASNYLQWSTASEQNSSYFEIQRSTDGVNFTDIAKVAAAGNSDKTKDYSYSDNQLSSISSVYYYRLKMVDIDGSSKYSSIISIKNSVVTISLAKVFPNPANNQFTITIKDNNLLNTKVTLNDISGKVLQTITITQVNTKVNISNYLSGLYILKFKNGNSIKVIKE